MRALFCVILCFALCSCSNRKVVTNLIEVVGSNRVEVSSMGELTGGIAVVDGLSYTDASLHLINRELLSGNADIEYSSIWEHGGSRLLCVRINRGKWLFEHAGQQQRLLEGRVYLIKVAADSFEFMQMTSRGEGVPSR